MQNSQIWRTYCNLALCSAHFPFLIITYLSALPWEAFYKKFSQFEESQFVHTEIEIFKKMLKHQ